MAGRRTGCWKSERGQTATEYMLIISVVVIAVVAAAFTFVPTFRSGVSELAGDVSSILSTGQIGGVGMPRGDGMNATASNHSQRCTDQSKDPRYAAMFDPPKCIEEPKPAPLIPAEPAPTLAERISRIPLDGRAQITQESGRGEADPIPAVIAFEDSALPADQTRVARRGRFMRRFRR